MIYYQHDFRLELVSQTAQDPQWLFFPGGPGLGAEYLRAFAQQLKLPGSVYLIDFPKDGTNTAGELSLDSWGNGLIALLKTFTAPIIVTHSFSAMYLLLLSAIEPLLQGLVLMNTTVSNSFFEHVARMQQRHNLPDLAPAAMQYHLNPKLETYKIFWETYKHYCYTPAELTLGEEMMHHFAYNSLAYYFAIEHIYPNYHSRWVPQQVLTMTIASEHDFICPPNAFIENEEFTGAHIINKLILQAGHCPWLLHQEQVTACFAEFITRLN